MADCVRGLSLDRIQGLQEALRDQKFDAALLFYSRDIYYYTGTAQPSYLFVSPDDYFLFVRSGMNFARREVFIEPDRMKEERRLENVFQALSFRFPGKRLGTELDLMTFNNYRKWENIFTGCEFFDASPLILEQRKTKDLDELDRIREACTAVDAGHQALLEALVPGKTELELAAAVENAHRLAGHEGNCFMRVPDFFMSRGPLSSGPDLFDFSGVVLSVTGIGQSAAVPAGPSRRKVCAGDLVVVDIPTLVKGYHADQTRTYYLGTAPPEIRELYEGLKDIADHVISRIRPGMECREAFALAEARAEGNQLGDAFLSFPGGRKSHMIGHGVGLECSEPPIVSRRESSRLGEDYVMAIEMHAAREGVGVVKLEDMIHIGRHKNVLLTRSPRTLSETG